MDKNSFLEKLAGEKERVYSVNFVKENVTVRFFGDNAKGEAYKYVMNNSVADVKSATVFGTYTFLWEVQ